MLLIPSLAICSERAIPKKVWIMEGKERGHKKERLGIEVSDFCLKNKGVTQEKTLDLRAISECNNECNSFIRDEIETKTD